MHPLISLLTCTDSRLAGLSTTEDANPQSRRDGALDVALVYVFYGAWYMSTAAGIGTAEVASAAPFVTVRPSCGRSLRSP
jgi:hypothetical protein